MGWTKYVEQQEKAEAMKCEMMKRKHGLIVSDDPEAYDCSDCECFNECEGR